MQTVRVETPYLIRYGPSVSSNRQNCGPRVVDQIPLSDVRRVLHSVSPATCRFSSRLASISRNFKERRGPYKSRIIFRSLFFSVTITVFRQSWILVIERCTVLSPRWALNRSDENRERRDRFPTTTEGSSRDGFESGFKIFSADCSMPRIYGQTLSND